MILKSFFLMTLFCSTVAISESIPINHFVYQSKKLLYDVGKDWNKLTIFSPIRFKINSSSYFDGQVGFGSGSKPFLLYASGYLKYNKNYYVFFNPVILNRRKLNYEDNSINYNDNKINRSGIGFENNWVTIQIGKGNESWGAGNDIQLALSESLSLIHI